METTIADTEQKGSVAPEVDLIVESGFALAADNVKKQRQLARKLRIAFEFHRIVTPENIAKFQADLKAKTLQHTGQNQWGKVETYDRLIFTPVENYSKCPPREVLEKVKEAKGRKIFDKFEVATVQSVTTVPDPIVFGIISGCENKFFISQWGEDVKIEDIVREDEG